MAAVDLTTTAKVKAHLGITDVAADSILGWLVTACSRWVETYLRREVKSRAATETFSGTGTYGLSLPRQPVTEVTTVKVNGTTIPKRPAVTEVEPYPVGWVLENGRVELDGYAFAEGLANVEVTYTAGYATAPEDLEQATIDLVALVYRSKGREGLTSRTVASGEVLAFLRPDALPLSIKLTLDAYRKVPRT